MNVNVCMYMYYIVLRATTKTYYLISPTYGGMSSAWLGSIEASSSAAVVVSANGSATHQSWSPSRPTADHAPRSTMEPALNYTHTHTHTHIKKLTKQ